MCKWQNNIQHVHVGAWQCNFETGLISCPNQYHGLHFKAYLLQILGETTPLECLIGHTYPNQAKAIKSKATSLGEHVLLLKQCLHQHIMLFFLQTIDTVLQHQLC